MTGKKRYRPENAKQGSVKIRSLADYEMIKLQNEAWGSAMEVIPGYGGRLNGLWLSDDSMSRSIIEGYKKSEDLLNDDFYHNVWLFPFVNRLDGGRYEFEGKTYQFPLNEVEKDNALHGFLYDKPFDLEKIGKEDDISFIKLRYKYAGEFDYYPFPFEISILYRLPVAHTFEVDVKLKNTGLQTAPVAFGWHLYLTFLHNVGDLRLILPSREKVEVNERLIPTGKMTKDDRFFKGMTIRETRLDDSFRLISGDRHGISLESERDQSTLTLSVDQAIDYIQLFIPPARQSIAVEPVTSNINAFKNQEGLLTMKPGASFSTNIKIKLTQTR